MQANRAARCVLLLAVACQQHGLEQITAGVEVSPASLDFGETWLGASRQRALTVHNTSKSPAQVTVSLPAPFSADAATLSLGATESATLGVRFAPTALGAASATLELVSDTQHLTVELGGTGVEPLMCPAPAPCRTSVADPEAGACVDGLLPDGTACSSACLTGGGTCLQGSCVGTSLSCDDHDACTVDFCDAVLGCGHAPRVCLMPSDPCKVAVCDPSSGCAFADAPDGTRCGDGDCITSHVCLQGACVEKPTPNGASCGDTRSPCQTPGTCQNQTCVLPPPGPMQPVWTVTTTGSVVFPGVADRAGNLYWYENGSSTKLVSVDRNGALRYRVAASVTPESSGLHELSPIILVADTTLVAYSRLDGTIEAFRTSDGSKLWSHDRARLKELFQISTAPYGPWIISIGEGANGDVIANVRSNAGGAAWTSWIAAFDRLTGAVNWSKAYDYLNELVIDAAGDVYTHVDLWEHRLVSISPTGIERYNLLVGNATMSGAAPPVMAVGSTLLTGASTVLRSVATGAVTATPPMPLYVESHWGPAPVMSATQLVVPDGNSFCSSGVWSFALPSFTQQWSVTPTDLCINDASITDRGTVFVSAALHGTRGMSIGEIDAQGAFSWLCEVAANGTNGPSVLNDGRWVVFDFVNPRVMAFDLPGVRLAPSGWVTAFGSNARGQRQR